MPEKNLIIVIALLLLCIALFVSRKMRPDFVALIAVAALSLSGVMTFSEALEGFANPIILMIAFMFVISEGLARTGVSYRVGDWIMKKSGDSLPRVIALTMTAVAILGSVMSTTAIIAIFLPIVLNICARMKISPSKLLMPLAFAGIVSGMMTLVATTPNMIMSALLEQETGKGFGFFSITPIGLGILAMAVAYMLYAHKFLGSKAESGTSAKARKNLDDFVRDYNLSGREFMFKLSDSSPLAGKSLKETELRSRYGANIVCIERRIGRNTELLNTSPDTMIRKGDVLFADMTNKRPRLGKIGAELGAEVSRLKGSYLLDNSMEIGMAEISVMPESEFIGRSLAELKFRDKFGLHAIGMRRNGRAVGGSIHELRLKAGDLILVVGPQKFIRRIHSADIDFMVLSIPAELADAATAPERAPYAIFTLAAMVVLMAFNIVPNALAALLAAMAMVAFKCLTMEAAYKSIKLPTLIIIMCMMPFAAALDKTGAVQLAAKGLFAVCGAGGPHVVLAGLFALTIFTGLFMSNTITSILIGPIAIAAAQMLNVSAYPFAMTVAVAASTAFMSPLSTSVNMLVWDPGRYGFWDFMRIGLPFSLIVMLASVFAIPLLFPF